MSPSSSSDFVGASAPKPYRFTKSAGEPNYRLSRVLGADGSLPTRLPCEIPSECRTTAPAGVLGPPGMRETPNSGELNRLLVLSCPLSGISRTFADAGYSSLGSGTAVAFCQAALSTRARRSTNPARPYICRLIVFTCWTDYTDRHTPRLGRYSGCACTLFHRSPEPGALGPAPPGGHTEGSTMPRTRRTRRLPAPATRSPS